VWGITLIVAAFVLGLIAFSFAFGAPVLAVPIAIVGVALIGAIDLRRRRRQARELHGFREEAKAESVEFTPRDRETLVSE
jgi:UDP-N-acetylmuramyl pentapeptide phosphotransferase/UDP-N-acetylglucosamine-1-phosphate transferase